MLNLFGSEPRSTYHTTCVRRVNQYLKRKCSKGGYEKGLVSGYRTDAFGYDSKFKTWYLCEIKVDPSDLKKAPQQILDTKFHFPKSQYFHIGDKIVPVIAIPARLAKFQVKTNEWDSLRNTCKQLNIAIWVIEQSTVREVMGPKIKKVAKASTSKKKTARTKKSASKRTPAKTKKARKATNTKKKITRAKTTKSMKRLVKSSKTKKSKTQSTKRKNSRKRKSTTKRKR